MAGRRKRKNEAQVKLAGWDGLIPVALYVRVSSAGQDVENSIDSQLQKLKEWAAQNGYVIVRIFIDEAKSGRADKRPDFQEMIMAAEEPDCPFEIVLVYKFSRFYRNSDESAFYKIRLKKKGIRVVSIMESQPDTAAGRFSEKVMEAADEYGSDVIGEEVRRGTRKLAERGFFIAGKAPFGTMRVPVQDGKRTRYKLAPKPETAIYIRRIFDLALEEKTEREVRIAANEEGIPNSSGNPWPDNRIHDVLTNVHYAGAVGWGMKTDDPLITWGAHEGIVEKTEFDRVQELLESRAHEVVNPRHAGSNHPFSGMMLCRKCKSKYTYSTAGKDGKIYLYIVCKNRKDNGPEACDAPWIPAPVFEQRAMAAILEDIATPANMESAMEELRAESGKELDKANTSLEAADRSIKDIEARRDKVYAAYEAGGLTLEKYLGRNQELNQMKSAAETERSQVLDSAGDRMIILDNPEAVISHTKNLNEFLRQEEPGRCRSWLNRFIKRIWIEHGQGTVEYTIPLPADEKFLRISSREFILGKEFRPSTRDAPPSVRHRVQVKWRPGTE